MSDSEIRQKLDELSELRGRRAALVANIQVQIATLETERDALVLDLDNTITLLTKDVKSATLEHGASVKAIHLHAVWSKPRVSWDSKGLGGYAVAHPEVLAFRKEGKPSVSIRMSR